jgi:hypothetical protein
VALDDVVATLGPVNIFSATTLTGEQLTTGGSASLVSVGDLTWQTLNVGGSLMAQSISGALTIGQATSGGTQTLLAAEDITFGRLTTTGTPGDVGDIHLTSSLGGITGDLLQAHGGVTMDAAEDIEVTTLTALGPVELSSKTRLKFGTMTIGSGSDLDAPIVEVADLKPSPDGVPDFNLSIAGYDGAVGTFASVFLDAPDSRITLNRFYETDAVITTNSSFFSIADGYIYHTLDLTTPYQTLYMNNQWSEPINNIGVQLFAPHYSFHFIQDRYYTTTNTYVVQYNDVANIIDELSTGTVLGASFLHDFERMAYDGDLIESPSFDDFGLPPLWQSRRKPLREGAIAPQLVPPVRLTVGDEIWSLVSGKDGLSIDVRRAKAH